MSYTEFLLAWAAFHLAMALLCAALAVCWGRGGYPWFLIGAVLGPLALVVLVALHMNDRSRGHVGSP